MISEIATVTISGGDEDLAAEKEAFEFYVHNYPNKKRKKRVIGTKTAAERGGGD